MTRRGAAVNGACSGASTMAAARVCSSCFRYLGLARKAISPSPARSSVLTWRIRTPPSPSTWPPQTCAISFSVNGPAVGAAGMETEVRRWLFVGQEFDDPIGDIDPRASPYDWLLQNEVEFFDVGDLLDDLVGALLQTRQFL